MADVGTVANYAEIIGAMLVVGGLTFAVFELRQARVQRRRESAFEMFRSMGSDKLLAGVNLLYQLPPGLTKGELEKRTGEALEEIKWMLYQFENLGVMVYNRVMPIDLAEEFFQVSIVNTWVKLETYIQELRQTTGKPQLYAAVEWLAELVQHRNRDMGAVYSSPQSWRP